MNKYFSKLEEEKYLNFPFHSNIQELTRLVAKDTPYHISVHQIKNLKESPEIYVELHKHKTDELNIILAADGEDLVYRIQIEDDIQEVSAPCFIWIPKDKAHSANAIKGRGTYICIIMQDKYEAHE